MIEIEDLGTVPRKDGRGTRRYAIYECEGCGKQARKVKDNTLLGRQCSKCHGKNILKDLHTTHGDWGSSLYMRWRAMLDRCYNPKNQGYKSYGAKGVTVCKEWRDSYAPFKEWAEANGYKKSLEIDKDHLCNKLGISPKIYSPDTCMWLTMEENRAKVKSIDLPVIYDLWTSQNKTHTEIASMYDVCKDTISNRLNKYKRELLNNTAKV